MNAALASRLPLEVLHNIGDIYIVAVDSGSGQSLVQHRSCRANKRPALDIFFIARLFAYHHYPGVAAAFSKHSLRSQLPQIAGLAYCRSFAQILQAWPLRDKGRSRGQHPFRHKELDAATARGRNHSKHSQKSVIEFAE